MITRDGKDVTVHMKAISEGHIQKLYTGGVFALEDPVSLQNKVFCDIVLNFGRCGQEGIHTFEATKLWKIPGRQRL